MDDLFDVGSRKGQGALVTRHSRSSGGEVGGSDQWHRLNGRFGEKFPVSANGRECEVGNVGCGAFYSRNLSLADWQVCGKLTGRNGSRALVDDD